MEFDSIEIARMETVCKSNELIRKYRHALSTQQQKIILYLISQIKPTDEEFKLYKFNIREFCEICGIEYSGNYTALKDTIKQISDKSVWARLPNGKETLLRWIEKPYINEGSNTIEIKMDRDMMPHLLQLKGNFTQFELISTLAMKSSHSIRLFELFKSYEYLGEWDITVEELKEMLNTKGEFNVFADFKRQVIDKAIREIEEYSGLCVSYSLIKQGRKAIGFHFTIENVDANGTILAEYKLMRKQNRRMLAYAK